jgi:hypothetical protein
MVRFGVFFACFLMMVSFTAGDVPASRFISSEECHKVCDKSCEKWGGENELAPPEGGLCYCSCCDDSTGLFCYKCVAAKLPEPKKCMDTIKWKVPQGSD